MDEPAREEWVRSHDGGTACRDIGHSGLQLRDFAEMPEAVKAVAAVSREPVRMDFVRRADHHLYIDNPEDFHAKVARAIDA